MFLYFFIYIGGYVPPHLRAKVWCLLLTGSCNASSNFFKGNENDGSGGSNIGNSVDGNNDYKNSNDSNNINNINDHDIDLLSKQIANYSLLLSDCNEMYLKYDLTNENNQNNENNENIINNNEDNINSRKSENELNVFLSDINITSSTEIKKNLIDILTIYCVKKECEYSSVLCDLLGPLLFGSAPFCAPFSRYLICVVICC